MTDDHARSAMSAYGNQILRTPNLDRLGQSGLTFRRFFVQNPVCMPSRVSFLTGQYPSTLGITHMGVPVPEDMLTLPRMLKPYGYRCANVGKLLNNLQDPAEAEAFRALWPVGKFPVLVDEAHDRLSLECVQTLRAV